MNAASAASALSILGVGAAGILDSIGDSEWDSSDLSVTNGGTGASNEEDAKENLMIGVDRGTGTSATSSLRCVPDAQEFISEWLGDPQLLQGWEWTNTTSNWLGAIGGGAENSTTSTGRAQFHTGNNLLIVGSMAYAMETRSLSRHCPRCRGIPRPLGVCRQRHQRNRPHSRRSSSATTGSTRQLAGCTLIRRRGDRDRHRSCCDRWVHRLARSCFVCDADGSEVRFYIANSLVATHNTTSHRKSHGHDWSDDQKSAGTTGGRDRLGLGEVLLEHR